MENNNNMPLVFLSATVRVFALFILLLFAYIAPSAAKEPIVVKSTTAYINVHTGPGRGSPIFHVIEKGETITLLKLKTDWIKIITIKGQEGWLNRRDLDNTIGLNGELVDLGIPDRGDFANRKWEFGATVGEFDEIPSIGLHGAWRFTQNLSLEMRFNQATGGNSNSKFYGLGLVHQPFPEWRVSPFFTLSNGTVEISPNVNLSQSQDRSDSYFMAGLGLYTYFTHRVFIRFEVNQYTTLPDRDNNENVDEWKIGLSTFF